MTLQEQTVVRTKAQLGLATEAELVALAVETFDAEIVGAELDANRCFTCGEVEGWHAGWCALGVFE